MKKLWRAFTKVVGLALSLIFGWCTFFWPSKAQSISPPLQPVRVKRRNLQMPSNPQGFREIPFDVSSHPLLGVLRPVFVNELFRQLNLDWVPPEYFQFLTPSRDPIDAFCAFCRRVGIDADSIRRRNPAEIAILKQVLGILLELGVLNLQGKVREPIESLLEQRDYLQAEEKLDVARGIFKTLSEVEAHLNRVIFGAYREFHSSLQGCAKEVFALSRAEAEGFPKQHLFFLQRQEELDNLLAEIDQQIGWMIKYWPQGSHWAQDNDGLIEGADAVKEEVLQRLRSARDYDLSEPEFADLRNLQAELLFAMQQIQDELGQSWQRPTPGNSLWKAWVDALELLGFEEQANPSQAEIIQRFRSMAMRYHPDRHYAASAKVRGDMETKFKEINAAYQVLLQGCPKDQVE